MKKIIAIALTALMLAAMLCGCTANTTKGKLVLGTSADYPPFEFHMLDENGKDVIVGIDIPLLRRSLRTWAWSWRSLTSPSTTC